MRIGAGQALKKDKMEYRRKTGQYTCNDYRIEMQLLGLNRRLAEETLTDDERQQLLSEIKILESQMGL